MSTCPKCGKEVEPAAQVCICGAALDQAPPGPEQPAGTEPSAKPTRGQLARAGAKGGALLGALYGGMYGVIQWVILLVFTVGDTASKIEALVQFVLVCAVLGALILAALGALFRMLFPPKPREQKKVATDPSAKTDTKIDP